MISKVIVAFASVALSSCAIAAGSLEKVSFRIAFDDGRTEMRSAATELQPDGAWRARFRTIDMTDDMKWIDVISDAAVVPKCDGYWTLGDCRYGAFSRDVMARETTTGEHTRLAMFGVKTPQLCFVAIVKGLPLEHEQRVGVKDGVYTVYVRYDLKRIEFYPYEDVVIDFYPLTGDDANYSGMARRYRAHQLTEGGCQPLRERVKGNPALAYSAESIFLRCKFGRCDRRLTTDKDWIREMPPVVVDNTFDDFIGYMRACKAMGMDKVEMNMVGFQPQGHDGPFPDLFPADERFGGDAKMREAIAVGKSLGYRMSIHLNQYDYYRNARRFRAEDACKGPDGELRKYTVLPGGQAYFTCYEVICNRYFDDDLAYMKDLGLDGIVHVDVMSARRPERCHDPRHPNNAKRASEWVRRLALKARAAFGGYSSECGVDHFASALDNVLYQAPYPGWGVSRTDLTDGYLPTWSIVYNGIIMSNPFYATIDASVPREDNGISDAVGESRKVFHYLDCPEKRMLKVFEFGGRPMFYYANYRTDLPHVKRMYEAWQPLKHLQYEFIREHVALAPDVFAMRYENGEEVVCNYTSAPFAYRGREVKPLDYALFGKFADAPTCTRK